MLFTICLDKVVYKSVIKKNARRDFFDTNKFMHKFIINIDLLRNVKYYNIDD